MACVSRVLPPLSEAEVKEKMRTARNFRQQIKWEIVYNALVARRRLRLYMLVLMSEMSITLGEYNCRRHRN